MRWITRLVILLASALAATAGEARAQEESAAFAPAARLLQSRCAMPGCHAGPGAAQGLRLEAAEIYRATVNVHAHTDGRYLRVSPGAPDRSLLYLKLLSRHDGNYRGPRMPLSMEPLKDDQIALVRQWIESFPADLWGHPPAAEAAAFSTRTFQDAYLANLPTSDPLGTRTLEFRIVHRFKAAAADAGSHGLYGLDSGAWISLDVGYGLNDRLDLGLRRTNLDTDYEGYAKLGLLRQSPGGAPLSLSLRGSVSDVRETGRVNRTRLAAQAIVARRFGDRISLMLVPGYVTHTDDLNGDVTGGTAAIGAGAEWRLTPRVALTGEWVAQTAGLKAPFQSGSIGLSMATARHVFHLLLTNTPGSHTDQYLPGGDLDPGNNGYRLGFNISRTHSFVR